MLKTFKNYLKKTLFKEDFEELEKLKNSYKKTQITQKQEKHIEKLAVQPDRKSTRLNSSH